MTLEEEYRRFCELSGAVDDQRTRDAFYAGASVAIAAYTRGDRAAFARMGADAAAYALRRARETGEDAS